VCVRLFVNLFFCEFLFEFDNIHFLFIVCEREHIMRSMLKCVAVCCGVLQCVAKVSNASLQCIAVHYRAL